MTDVEDLSQFCLIRKFVSVQAFRQRVQLIGNQSRVGTSEL